MRDEKSTKITPRRKTAIRLIKWVVAVVVVLIVLAFLLTPAFVSSKQGRQIILGKVNKYINGRANFDALSMGWFKGIRIWNLSFNDNAGWASVQVKQIATKPHYGSLLMGNLSFGQTTIDQPSVSLDLKNRPATELEHPGKPATVKAASTALVMDVVVNDGSLRVTDSKDRTIEVSQINSTMSIRPPGKQTSFNIDMAVADKDSKISAAGQVTPGKKTGWSLKGTTGDFNVEVSELNLTSLEPILELAKVELQAKGIVSANVTSGLKDGRLENLAANIKAKNLDITGPLLKGDRLHSSILDADVKLSQKEQTINIDRLQLQSDWAQASAGGTVPTTFKSLTDLLQPDSRYSLKGNFSCDLAAILSQMPRTIGLKEGIKVTSGRLSGNVDTFTQAGKATIAGQANLTGLAGTVDGKKLALSEPVIAEVKITGEKDKISFDQLDVSAAFTKINATGSLEQIKYDAQVDLAKLQSELGQFVDIGPYQMAGELSGKGQVSIKDERIAAAGSSVVKELRLSSKEGVTASEPMAEVAFGVDYDKKASVVTIGSVNANASFGQVSVKDAVLPLGKEAAKPVKLLASAQKINLEKLQPFMVLFTSFPKDMQLAGEASSQFSITSEKDVYRIVTDSTKIRNFRLTSPNKEPFQQAEVLLMLDAEINPSQKSINVKNIELISPQIKLKKGQFNKVDKDGKTKLEGRLDCEYDWAAINPILPPGLKLKGKNKLPIEFSSVYPSGQTEKLLDHLSTKGKLGFEEARYMGMVFGAAEAQIQIRDGFFTIAPFSTTVNNGQFNFAAEADFKQEPKLLKTPQPIQIIKNIEINDEMSKKLLSYLNPIFAEAINVSGIANFDCDRLAIPLTSTNKSDIEVIGTISANKLRLQTSDLLGQILSIVGGNVRGQEITIHPTKFFLQKGFLRYDDMQVDVGENPVNFKGVIGLDKSLNMMVTLPYTTAGRTARVGRETSGQRITLPLKGTVTKPELDTGKLIEQQLQKQLEEQLRRGLEEIFR